nr:YdiU family protein [Derxia gummosa]
MQFANRFARHLPGDFYAEVDPVPLPSPHLVAVSRDACRLLDLDPAEFERRDIVEMFSGNRTLGGTQALAAVYSGHQFGVWAGQLGDGRAHLLGELETSHGHFEVQIKGGGQTPYSRFADGRAVLRSSIREFLCSEAMAALGIPTTRALCITGSPQPVARETVETAAVVTRLAPSFVRFGSFEHWAALKRHDQLRTLADFVIDTQYPQLRGEPQPYAALLKEVALRTGRMVAHWQAVGFMHGVMNTDNMSILGLTLDYGPFGFMEAFDALHICNHSDSDGRYAYRAQPQIAHWNLYRLGNALYPLIDDADAARKAIEDGFGPGYNDTFFALMRAKFGLATAHESDDRLIRDWFQLLQDNHPDFTTVHRALAQLPAEVAEADRSGADAPLRDQFIDRDACDRWLAQWRARLALDPPRTDADRRAAMNAVNPKYVLRNWIAEGAIRAARDGDFSEIADVLRCLRHPFDEQPEFERYAAPPPDWANGLAVSCSS